MNFPWKYYRALIFIAIVTRTTTGVSNGEFAAVDEFRYTVGLVHISCCNPFCTGALIDPSHVLTAGHCVAPLEAAHLEVSAGVVDWGFNIWGKFRSVDRIHLHPDYKPGMQDVSLVKECAMFACQCFFGPARWKLMATHDIAVLKLNAPFGINDNIELVSLPQLDAPPPYGINCIFAGWGSYKSKTDFGYLHWTEFQILDAATCRDRGRHLRDEGEFCALHPNETAFTEPGDSGGPLVCDGVIVGVLQSGGLTGRQPSTFPQVSYYIPFIEHACRN